MAKLCFKREVNLVSGLYVRSIGRCLIKKINSFGTHGEKLSRNECHINQKNFRYYKQNLHKSITKETT